MYTFKTFLVLALVSYVVAAPPADEPAECKAPQDTDGALEKCCKLDAIKGKEQEAAKECFKLVKDKDEKKGPLTPEGYACMGECIMSKLGFLGADKTIDAAKINAAAKTMYTGDWAEVGAKFVEKCLGEAAEEKAKSESGAHIYLACIFREAYMNCPEKSWTASDACKANKERLTKCPKSIPFIGKKPE